ncbi:MAG: sensor histidine kinase [Chitinophagales bacterium]
MKTSLEPTWMDYILQKRWLTHLLFWVLFVLLFSIFGALNSGYFFSEFIIYIAMLPAYLLATYSLVYYLSPRFLFQKKYPIFTFLFLLSAYICTALARLGMVYLAEPLFRTDDFTQESIGEILTDPLYLFAVYFPAIYLIVFIFFAIKNIKDRFEEKHQIEVLQKEKATNELRFLKAQIHPHFLFNTLNNLYSLTLEQSPKAPEVVLKLSEILDYMLYQSEELQVPIERELQLIQNYLDLESLRYGERLTIRFKNELASSNGEIAPLILLSLVENAFKHGVSKHLKKAWVEIEVRTETEQLFFFLAYSKPPITTTANAARKGIGSNNVQRQLDLIYPNRHQLTIDETEETYSVQLVIFNK